MYFIKFKRDVSFFYNNVKKYVRQNIQLSLIKKILMIFSGSWVSVMIKFPYNHFSLAYWTVKRIHPESLAHLPLIKWISWYGNVFLKNINCIFKPVRNMPWIKSVAVTNIFNNFKNTVMLNIQDMLLNVFSPCHAQEGHSLDLQVMGNKWVTGQLEHLNLTKPFEISLQARNLFKIFI